MIERDIAIIICSRGREDVLARLLRDLERGFAPALDAGGLTHCIFVYAQDYAPEYLDGLSRGFADAVAAKQLVITTSSRPHTRIGDVVHTAIRNVHGNARYKLAMLMDDDSVYGADPIVDENIRRAARAFIERGHRAYSIKLGSSYELDYQPFVNLDGPIMPFKEKMLWVSRPVLDAVLATPRFAELSIGEDAVIAAVAWLSNPDACFGVYGMATFLHLGYEPSPEFGEGEIEGGYAGLMKHTGPPTEAAPHGKYDEALRSGITPHHVMPDVFVPEDHPHYIYNGIRQEVIARMRGAGRAEGAREGVVPAPNEPDSG
jgi:hypothetical protein